MLPKAWSFEIRVHIDRAVGSPRCVMIFLTMVKAESRISSAFRLVKAVDLDSCRGKKVADLG